MDPTAALCKELVAPSELNEGSSLGLLSASTAPGAIDYTADSDFCLDDFIDFDGAAGRQHVRPARKRSSRRPRRPDPAPWDGLAPMDDEMVLPPSLQPIMIDRAGGEHSSSFANELHEGRNSLKPELRARSSDGSIFGAHEYKLDLNDSATRNLYDKLLLFSHETSSQGSLVFENCDTAAETALRELAVSMFKLNYSLESDLRRVTISRQSNLDFAGPTQGPLVASEYASVATTNFTRAVLDHGTQLPVQAEEYDYGQRNSAEFTLPLRPLTPEAAGSSIDASPAVKCSSSFALPTVDTRLALSPVASKSHGLPNLPFGNLNVDYMPLDRKRPCGSLPRNLATPPGRMRYSSRHAKTSVRQKLHTWTSRTIDKYSGHLGILHEEACDPRAAKRRALFSKSLEDLGGPCWRCVILGLTCDAEETCRECPAASLEENAALWPLVGCRRGHLGRAMPPPNLCPGARSSQSCHSISSSRPTMSTSMLSERDAAGEYLRRAERQRLQDAKAILGDADLDAYSSRSTPTAAAIFVDVIKNRQYSDNLLFNRRYWSQGTSYTYAKLINSISWELMNNTSAAADLEIECVENFIQLLEVSSTCEGEFCATWVVILSLICLKDCLDALRLIYVGLLSPQSHQLCRGECEVSCISLLSSRVAEYVNELSRVLFKSERRDKHCWLSIFFSLYIQSFVRHGLLVINRHMNPPELADIPSDPHATTNYLHLAATLFGAASAQFDPVFPRVAPNVRAESPVPEHLQAYVSHARTLCFVEASYFEGHVATSFEFLRVLLQIGAPDFDQEDEDASLGDTWDHGADSVMGTSSHSGFEPASEFSTADSICLSNDQTSMVGDFTFEGQLAPSRQSTVAASTSFQSGRSSESLPTTFEPSVFSFEVQSPLAASFADYASTCSSHGRKTSMQSLRPYMEAPALNYATRPLPPLPVRRSPSPIEIDDEPILICDCCPKRPQIFNTREELQAHMQKKPHVCEICGTRSKNKNEAERHHTAVHVKPFSWTCQKLGSLPLSTFQVTQNEPPAPNPPNSMETVARPATPTLCYTCGFCGRTFHRKAAAPLMVGERLGELEAHVRTEHKFGMCTSEKKFFRDDNFAQHLKTVHAAVAGEWLKALVESCKSREG